MLVSKDLDFQINNEFRDNEENFLVIDCSINGIKYGIGAVYGPNNTSRVFYNGLSAVIRTLRTSGVANIVVGGDWNTTWDRRPVTDNIDTFCMAGLPNAKNSELLENMCFEFGLIDPYRALYPDRREYTYIPFGNVRLHRSRLDFFIITNDMLEMVHDCVIDSSLKCKLFDHKCVTLNILKKTQLLPKKNVLSNSFLIHKALLFSVEIATRKTHLYSLRSESLTVPAGFASLTEYRDHELARLDACLVLYKEYVRVLEREAMGPPSDLISLEKEAKEGGIRLSLEDMLPIKLLSDLEKRCNARDFFIALTKEIKKQASKAQRTLARHKKILVCRLEDRLVSLKKDYNANSGTIAEVESEIKVIRDCDLRERIRDIKIFECLNAEKATPLFVSL